VAGGRLAQGSVAISGNAGAWSFVVDTRGAGFSTTPAYFVTLAAHPLAQSSGFSSLDAGISSQLDRVLGPFVAIRSAGSTYIDVEVRLGVPASRPLPAWMQRAVEPVLPVAVDWLGVESATGCEPQMQMFLVGYVMPLAMVGLTQYVGGGG
jgi:hypothetical protein